jgi:hypothetical protein
MRRSGEMAWTYIEKELQGKWDLGFVYVAERTAESDLPRVAAVVRTYGARNWRLSYSEST